MSLISKLFTKRRFQFIETADGLHQLGGALPPEFTIPDNQFMASMQYLGFINNEGAVFSWLPFKLHLICPIYLDIEKVYLDYADANSPVLISPVNTAAITTQYDDLKADSVIVYEPLRVSLVPFFEEINEENDNKIMGIAGDPHWVQEREAPICPKTNKPMKFVCQLMSNGHVKTNYTNVKAAKKDYQPYFEEMNFWGDGSLYVFFEPTSKTACYFIQNTPH